MKKISLFMLWVVAIFSCTKEIKVTEVHTGVIQNITSDSASIGGEVTSNGNPDVTVKGICWSTATSPTTSDNKTEEGGGLGSFTSTLTGLEPETTYYVRAYALIDSKTVYAFQEQFTTLEVEMLPSVTTTMVSNISSDTATSGGQVTEDGGTDIIARGICWSTNSNPTTADSTLEDTLSGLGSFTSNLTGLASTTTYYLKAYAINSLGTGYGVERSFTTTCDGGVFTGNVTLTTQQQVVDFGANCNTEISGNLLIEEITADDIVDLSPLLALTGVGGNVKIKKNTALTTLEGLNNLTWVGGQLYIYDIINLTNLDTFSSLVSTGSLILSQNENLMSIDGLSGVTTVVDFLGIRSNPLLTNLDGFSGVISVGGELQILENSSLIDLCGLTTLITTQGGLGGAYSVEDNAYNPTLQDIIDGDCSQ